MIEALTALFKILIFPGFMFLTTYGMLLQFLDRKIYARLQNRFGPPWYQPLADFLKLIGKETIVPTLANKGMFSTMPVVSLAAVSTAFVYIPIYRMQASFSFEGDLIIVLYLMALPSITTFLAGWYSRSVYATIGSVRTLTQLFAYEVPLFAALLSPSIISGSWSISGMAEFYYHNPTLILVNLPSMFIALISIQGKLARKPFDSPEAETEIVSGAFVEYSGRLLAIFKMSVDCELVLLISLAAAIYIPLFTNIIVLDILLYFAKTLVLLFALSIFKAAMARLRMDQIINFCWKVLTPLAMFQIIINLIVRGAL